MKPKTELDRQVLKLSSKLPDIRMMHRDWAYKKCFENFAYTTKYKAICFECGHEWKVDDTTTLLFKLTDVICPGCKRKLKVKESKAWSHRDWSYFEILTTFRGFQVTRIFFLNQFLQKGYPAHYSCMEVTQHWITPEGKLTVLGRQSNPMGGWRSGHTAWIWGSPMEIRNKDNDKFFVNQIPTYPRKRFIPELIRNGFIGDYFKFNHTYFMHILLRYPQVETLVKANQIEILRHFDPKDKMFLKRWPQIKMCIRHKYKIRDGQMWLDHLKMLEEEGKDIFSPKYVCPKSLKQEHQKLIDIRQKRREKEELEKLLVRLEALQVEYAKNKAKFFGFSIEDKGLKIVVLDHVKEFYLEGKALHHCVFSSTYYASKNRLMLSARKNDQRLETIEVNLESMQVVQARGLCNQSSKYHTRIVKLMDKALPEIAKLKKRKGNHENVPAQIEA